MKLILFTKLFKQKSAEELAAFASETGLDGFDLCVRKGYFVNPDNVRAKLPEAVKFFARHKLSAQMVTAEGNLLRPDAPQVKPLLEAMDDAGVRLLKLGYYNFNPLTTDYWSEVDRVRGLFEQWQALARKHHVKICYHTHCYMLMGLNCASMMHLLRGFDPALLGAYIDTAHLVIEGEDFALGTAMVRNYLSIVGIKDVLLVRQQEHDHGCLKVRFIQAGQGMVNWTQVFAELRRINFQGPVVAHCEFSSKPEDFERIAREEIAFYRKHIAENVPAALPPEPYLP